MMFSSWIVQDLRQDPTDKKRILHRILHGIAQEDLNIHVLVILSGSWKKKVPSGETFQKDQQGTCNIS